MATKRLTTTRRQKRVVKIPAPTRKGNIKVPLEGWVNCARVILIEEGIGGIKVDRLAKRLGVTRGGFYHHFSNYHELLKTLLEDWRQHNRFIPADHDTSSVKASIESLERITDNLVHERHFDSQFDMAVREWARISQPVADIVHQVDDGRIQALQLMFAGFGYNEREAFLRARMFYWQQIGYYALGVQEPLDNREVNRKYYHDMLGGEKYTVAKRDLLKAG